MNKVEPGAGDSNRDKVVQAAHLFRVSPFWLIFAYMVVTLGELMLSPMGLSLVSKVAPIMQKAIIAAEDHNFYKHNGVDAKGIARAFVNNSSGAASQQGASTLTQQYVNNLIIDRDVRAGDEASTLGANKGYADKIQEMIHSLRT